MNSAKFLRTFNKAGGVDASVTRFAELPRPDYWGCWGQQRSRNAALHITNNCHNGVIFKTAYFLFFTEWRWPSVLFLSRCKQKRMKRMRASHCNYWRGPFYLLKRRISESFCRNHVVIGTHTSLLRQKKVIRKKKAYHIAIN